MSNIYVSLEEVTELLKNWESITSNCNTIEESFAMLPDQVELLPTINLTGIIDEMISNEEYIEHNSFNERERTFGQYAKIRLQELKQRLTITPQ